MRFAEVTLAGPVGLTGFYGDVFGLPLEGDAIRVGETRLRFTHREGSPFYHFALLVPGDRFEAAQAWAEQRVEILRDAEGTRVFESDDWNSSAVYFHDPAGNILELIAHSGIEETARSGGVAGAPARARERRTRPLPRHCRRARPAGLRGRAGPHVHPRPARPGLGTDRTARRAAPGRRDARRCP